MIQALDLNGAWQVTWSEGMHGNVHQLLGEVEPARWLDVPVPMELHQALLEKGLIDEPNQGLNSLNARWVEEQYWQYQREFTAPAESLKQPVWLVFGKLDVCAQIFLNGKKIGEHKNSHRPCRIHLTGKLQRGANKLTVIVEAGLYETGNRNGIDYHNSLDSLLTKRHLLRKSQCESGWDWSPRLMNVGISGNVHLEWARDARLDQLTISARPVNQYSQAEIQVRAQIEGLHPGKPVKAILRASVRETGQEASVPIELKSDLHAYDLKLMLDQPRLWWPVGHGEQFLYTLQCSLEINKQTVAQASQRIGIRSVEIDRPPHPVEGEYFILKINGRPIFCKGGNWVPPDLIPSRVPRRRLEQLVDLAVQANFNLLRVWGGGHYAGHDLLELCDERGVLVWHDFLFACAKYPGDQQEFLGEVETEITWAIREFAAHPSLAVWCGNNELEWGYHEWTNNFGRTYPDYGIFHNLIPRRMLADDPWRPYWPSSPYSGNGHYPNDPLRGDQHPWGVTLMADGSNIHAYRTCQDRFANEGGVLGSSSPATLRQCLPPGEQRVGSITWQHHDNAANYPMQGLGCAYKLVEEWLGRPIGEYNMDDYAFASGLLHAEGLMEFINNYRGRMFDSAAAVFWMYNDVWPATHSWTIVDYYLRRKLAYHPVRRAFAPVTVVVAEREKEIVVLGINDGPQPWSGRVRYGLFDFAGTMPLDETIAAELLPNAVTRLAAFKRSALTRAGVRASGAFAVLLEKSKALAIAQHRLLLARFQDLSLKSPRINISRKGDSVIFESAQFVWGVCIDPDGEAPLADDVFDLLPNIPYSIPWPRSQKLPKVKRTGNELVVIK